MLLALWLFLEKTSFGLIIRAGARDPQIVRVLGVDVARVWLVVFGIGTAIAGLAGLLAAPLQGVNPEMGGTILAEAFVVTVVGGMGSIVGAVLAGLLVGVVVSMTSLFAPEMAQGLDLRADGGGAADPAAGLVRPRRIDELKVKSADERAVPAMSASAGVARELVRVRRRGIVRCIASLFVLVFPLVMPFTALAVNILIYGLYALGFNLLFGYLGLLSFGHAAFSAPALISAASRSSISALPWFAAIALGIVGGLVMAALIGVLAIRTRGIYFAMVTLALAQCVYYLFYQASTGPAARTACAASTSATSTCSASRSISSIR